MATAKKVLLVNYAGYVVTGNTFVADSSLATLAAVLEREGIPVEIVDLQRPSLVGAVMDGADRTAAEAILGCLGRGEPVDQATYGAYRAERDARQHAFEARMRARLLEQVAHEDVGLVGFKLWGGNGLAGAIDMAEAIRERFPHVRLVAGGPAVNYVRETFFARTRVFDAIVAGDGEDALLSLVRGELDPPGALRRGEDGRVCATPPVFRRDLDRWPMPTYAPLVYPGVGEMFPLRVIDDSRGCFNRCSFCSHKHLSYVTRMRSPARVVDEMEAGLADGVSHFRLSGSNPPRKFLAAIGREVERRGLDVSWSAYASMNNVDPETFPMLAASGLRALFFGIESGDPSYLRRVHNKNNRTPEHVVSVAEAAMRAGIFLCLSVIVPSPFETAETTRATFELLGRIFAHDHNGAVLALPAFLAPGSDWWARPSDYGFAMRPGWDRERLALHLLDWDNDFLLPRGLSPDAGYLLNGKSSFELFDECQRFIESLERAGIPTNVDDASFMIARSLGTPVRRYKAEMITRLVAGRAPTAGFARTPVERRRPAVSGDAASHRLGLA